jgi:hypothetical protein
MCGSESGKLVRRVRKEEVSWRIEGQHGVATKRTTYWRNHLQSLTHENDLQVRYAMPCFTSLHNEKFMLQKPTTNVPCLSVSNKRSVQNGGNSTHTGGSSQQIQPHCAMTDGVAVHHSNRTSNM